jgi:KDO2-lipid IV(A) lauroyltransferase
MTQDAPPFRAALLAPRHWPAWIGLAAIWLVARWDRNRVPPGL